MERKQIYVDLEKVCAEVIVQAEETFENVGRAYFATPEEQADAFAHAVVKAQAAKALAAIASAYEEMFGSFN